MPCDAGATVRVDDAGRDSRAHQKGSLSIFQIFFCILLEREDGKIK